MDIIIIAVLLSFILGMIIGVTLARPNFMR
jgi:uncharacterized protein YneF (UPF0154 family)